MIKASELPVGTTIEATDKDALGWERASNDYWVPTQSHCVDCEVEDTIKNEEIDEKVPNFKILTVPYAVAEFMNEEFAKMTGSGLLLKSALLHVKQHAS